MGCWTCFHGNTPMPPKGVCTGHAWVGISNVRFWTFNVADIGISAGAVLLLIALGRRHHNGLDPAA